MCCVSENREAVLKNQIKFAALFICLCVPAFAQAVQAGTDEQADDGECAIFQIEVRKLQKCRVYLPEDYDSTRTYPLVIGLHGYGGNARGFSRIWEYLEPHTFIYAVPEAPYPISDLTMESTRQYSWEFRGDDAGLWREADPWISEFIVRVADFLGKKYRIEKTCLFGFSQGAAWAYITGIRNPEVFHGIICFGGRLIDPLEYDWLLTDGIIRNGRDLKVFIAHGRGDDTIGYQAALDAGQKLKDFGYDVELVLFEGGHTIVRSPLEKALEWMGIRD